MLLNKTKYFKNKVYSKIIFLLCSFLLFGIIYFLFCDDYEFGGINLLQKEIRDSSVKKFVDKIEKGEMNEEIKDEISKELSRGKVDKQLDKKISKEVKHPSVEEGVRGNKIQKFFDRFYFAVVTGSTLGYGDIHPLSNKVKCLVVIQLFVTISILFY
tara:strand:+ start:820 stop:1290 length:471 start_codon:yes stop_codon:yes gene_type:complete